MADYDKLGTAPVMSLDEELHRLVQRMRWTYPGEMVTGMLREQANRVESEGLASNMTSLMEKLNAGVARSDYTGPGRSARIYR